MPKTRCQKSNEAQDLSAVVNTGGGAIKMKNIYVPSHFENTFKNLHQLQKLGKLCDIKLVMREGAIMAHSLVLRSSCNFFSSRIDKIKKDGHLSELDLTHRPYWVVQRVVNFLYSGHIQYSKDESADLLMLCEELQIHPLCERVKNDSQYNDMRTKLIEEVASKYNIVKRTSSKRSNRKDIQSKSLVLEELLSFVESSLDKSQTIARNSDSIESSSTDTSLKFYARHKCCVHSNTNTCKTVLPYHQKAKPNKENDSEPRSAHKNLDSNETSECVTKDCSQTCDVNDKGKLMKKLSAEVEEQSTSAEKQITTNVQYVEQTDRIEFKETELMGSENSIDGQNDTIIDHSDDSQYSCSNVTISQEVKEVDNVNKSSPKKRKVTSSLESHDSNSGSSIPVIKNKCKKCNTAFESEIDYTQHLKECKVNKPRRRCILCKISFESCEDYMHHRKNDPQCLATRKEKHEKRLRRKAQLRSRYACRVCPRKFRRVADHIDHEYVAHELPYDKEKWPDLFCEWCNYWTMNPWRLHHHKTYDCSKGQQFICDVCGNKYKNEKTLKCHREMMHTDMQPMLTCEECGKSLKGSKGLEHHIRLMHKGENLHKRHMCHICSMKYSSSNNLIFHLYKVHDQSLPEGFLIYECSECDYVTNNKRTYQKHLQLHDDKRDWKCEMCPKAFKTKNSLHTHIKSHIGEKIPCPYDGCSYSSLKKCHLKAHIENQHTQKGVKNEQCHVCSYSTFFKGNLIKHLRTVHQLEVVTRYSVQMKAKYKNLKNGQIIGQVVSEDQPLQKMAPTRLSKGTSSKHQMPVKAQVKESNQMHVSSRMQGSSDMPLNRAVVCTTIDEHASVQPHGTERQNSEQFNHEAAESNMESFTANRAEKHTVTVTPSTVYPGLSFHTGMQHQPTFVYAMGLPDIGGRQVMENVPSSMHLMYGENGQEYGVSHADVSRRVGLPHEHHATGEVTTGLPSTSDMYMSKAAEGVVSPALYGSQDSDENGGGAKTMTYYQM